MHRGSYKGKVLVLLLSVTLMAVGCSTTAETATGDKSETDKKQNEVNAGNGQGTGTDSTESFDYGTMTPEEITATLTLEQKAAQMVQPAVYNASPADMEAYDYGSILSDYQPMDTGAWKELVLSYQEGALASEAKIPFVYGTDAVHGNIKATGTVVFPHNIGIGAADDEELTYQMGLAVADEMKMSGMLWNFSPCVATAADPRWGRTYESYSDSPALVESLSVSYAKGLMDGGVLPCAKHYLGDGMTAYGTGEGDYIIDRGDAPMTQTQIDDQLSIYKALVDAGVQSIMVSHSSVNGVKMHESEEYITKVLKGDMGFSGMVVSDWESIHNISGASLKDQVIISVNAGIDMLMEPEAYQECMNYIVEGVEEGSISQERVDDAVTRILRVKKDLGILSDPMQENLKTTQTEPGSQAYRDLARQLVEKSLVLLKNDNSLLPLKKGSSVYIMGLAADDTGALCGGWTITWQGEMDGNGSRHIEQGTTILDGFKQLAEEYDLTIITDPKKADQADVVILCVGEIPYAEWEGDTSDLSLTGELGLPGNKEAIKEAKKLGKPTVTCIVAGRNVMVKEYMADWDSVVMCYLPGSEGGGVANDLVGKSSFTGKLPMPWYESVDDIGTGRYLFEEGYGLTIK